MVREARVAIGASRPTPFLSTAAAGELAGSRVDDIDEAAARAAHAAADDSAPITDVRAGADYRRAMVEVIVRRAAHAAAEGNEGAS